MTQAPFVLIDDNLSPGGGCLLFEDPREIVACSDPQAVGRALDRIAEAQREGLYAAGFLGYELGYLLEPKLAPLLPLDRTQPLIWMGLFAAPRHLDRRDARDFLAAASAEGGYRMENLGPSLERSRCLAAIERIHDYITAGDVYQINFTFRHRFRLSGDSLSLYAELRRRQPVAHGALMRGDDWHLLSLSPELFVALENGRLTTRPMKGTAPRGCTPDEDAALAAWLTTDEKSRAENLMIVDLLRNDLSRIAVTGSVSVPELFTVETYPTVHQMTSTVTAQIRPDAGFQDIVRALFPCGSVTGAPKVRAMEIIRELEDEPRGAYTGAVGMVAPCGDLRFNVAIRTLWIDASGAGEMGIGSGIVYDSDPAAEYDESILKARFLTGGEPPFQLIETMRWSPAGHYELLQRHLGRLAASAGYFGIPCDLSAARNALNNAVEGLAGVQRVRLLLDQDGAITVTATPIAPPNPKARLRFVVSDRPVDSRNAHRYHKTTRREELDGARERLAAQTGCDEVLFCNERGELTEGSYTNLFIERDGILLTPPVRCGLLDGTLRRELLEGGSRQVREQTLYPADLETADAIWLGNSVRGLLRAYAVDPKEISRDSRRAKAGGGAGRW